MEKHMASRNQSWFIVMAVMVVSLGWLKRIHGKAYAERERERQREK